MTLGERFQLVVQDARRGDERAIAALYADVTPALTRYLRAREPQEADDLCSETWIHLARLLPTFEGEERQWWGLVFLVARRTLNDHWKRKRRRRTDPVATEDMPDLSTGESTEELGIAAVTTAEAIRFVTHVLPPELADVVLLRVVAGLSTDEVATAMGKRPATIRVMQHRALKKLASGLESGTAGRAAAAGFRTPLAVSGPTGRESFGPGRTRRRIAELPMAVALGEPPADGPRGVEP